MTKLISTYAGATGLLIDKPNIKEHFYPHSFEKYITIQTGAGQNAKCYDLFQEVIVLIKQILDANKITILHLGAKDDPPLQGVHDLRGKTTFLQSNYLIKRSLCHVGNDSFLAHCAGWNHRPLVALYGSTDPSAHGPYWYDVANTVMLVSHRFGGRPTFIQQESPKSVNFIDPVLVANSVLKLLGITDLFKHSTTYIGPLYAHAIFDLIPNICPAPNFCPELSMTVRMDILFNEGILSQLLGTGRKVNIVTKRAIDIAILTRFKPQILTYAHETTVGVDEPEVGYTDAIRSIFPNNHSFFTKETDESKISALKFKYFDHVNISVHRDASKDDYLTVALNYLNRPNTPENKLDIANQLSQSKVKTNRYVLSGEKVYLSYAHLTAGQSIGSLADNTSDVIDDPSFWKDTQHFLITYHPK